VRTWGSQKDANAVRRSQLQDSRLRGWFRSGTDTSSKSDVSEL
jgi:hypothetical protein